MSGNMTETTSGESDDAVIFVYQDGFTCGPCGGEYVDLVEFMEHKAEHSLAPNIYKCELCKVIFSDQITLIEHYRSVHALAKFGEELLQQILQNNTITYSIQKGTEAADSDVSSKSTSVVSQEENTTKTGSSGEKEVTKHSKPNGVQKGKGRKDEILYLAAENAKTSASDVKQIYTLRSGSQETEVNEPDVDSNSQETDLHTMTSSEETMELEADQPNGKSVSRDTTDKSATENKEEGKRNSSNDFMFILKNVTTNSRTFSYAKLWFQCFHCQYKTQAKTALVKHMSSFHKDLCGLHKTVDIKQIDNKSDDIKVMKMSTYEKIHCSRPVKLKRKKMSKTVRKRNVEKQDLPGTFPCQQCNKVFGRLRYLRKHIATHRTERKYLCDECGKGFTTKTYLTHHRKIHEEKMYQCNQCEFTSNITLAVHAHRQIHTQSSVLCDICGLAYADKSALAKHKRVHDPERPFACTYPGCQWRFNSEVMCKAHVRAHTSEGKFGCSVCGYLFRHKHHLRRHEAKIHGSVISKAGPHTTETQVVLQECDIPQNTVNLVINTTEDGVETLEGMAQQLVVATGADGTPIAFESVDISSGNVYHTLLQQQDGSNVETQTVLLTQPETHIAE